MRAINFRKSIFYLFSMAFLVLLGAFVTTINAQQKSPATSETSKSATVSGYDECESLYKIFLEARCPLTREKRRNAIRAGRQFIEKCTDHSASQEVIYYLKKRIPEIERLDEIDEIISRFNDSIKDKKNVNAKEAFATGKQILDFDPNLIDVMLVLASIGFDQATAHAPVDIYNEETIYYAKQAIRKIENGKTSEQFGAYGFSYKTKENALAWMNYTIGYITYFRQNNRKAAIPFLYKATLYETGNRANPNANSSIYQAIGDYYKDRYNLLDDERVKLAAEAKDKNDEAELKLLRGKAEELLARQKSYGERMFDAYARAHHFAAAQDKAYKDRLYTNLKILYRFIFGGGTGGFEEYIKSVINSPMPEPPAEQKFGFYSAGFSYRLPIFP